jgi:hypothetical protein
MALHCARAPSAMPGRNVQGVKHSMCREPKRRVAAFNGRYSAGLLRHRRLIGTVGCAKSSRRAHHRTAAASSTRTGMALIARLDESAPLCAAPHMKSAPGDANANAPLGFFADSIEFAAGICTGIRFANLSIVIFQYRNRHFSKGSAMKSSSCPTQRNRIAIARRAAAIKAHWSARERNQRASLAKQLQGLLFASMALAAHESRAA